MIRDRTLVLALFVAVLGACSHRPAVTNTAVRDGGVRPVVNAHPVPVMPLGSSQGPWRALGAQGAATSPAVLIDGMAYSALAFPEESLAHAELRWVRWSADGASVLDRRQTTGTTPGMAMALLPRQGGGHTVVWIAGPVDGGEGDLRALDVGTRGFIGAERSAGPAEAAGVQWIREVMARRPRERAEEPAPVMPSQAGLLSVDLHRGMVAVSTGGVEVTRGDDLLGFERSVGAFDADGSRWIALSRGRCTDARVEVYRVTSGVPSLRASLLVGAELGVRWITVDAHASSATVTWYQDLIPLRLECARGLHAPAVTDHGVRVAIVSGGR